MGSLRLPKTAVEHFKSIILCVTLCTNHHLSVETSLEKCRTGSEMLLSYYMRLRLHKIRAIEQANKVTEKGAIKGIIYISDE